MYLEELCNCNVVDGVCLLAPEDLKKHVLNIGEICRLDVAEIKKKVFKKFSQGFRGITGKGSQPFIVSPINSSLGE